MKPLNLILNVVLSTTLLPLAAAFNHSNKASMPAGVINFSARDSTRTDVKNHTLKLYGAASLTNGKVKINADYIEFNQKDSTATAIGHVVFYNMQEKVLSQASSGTFRLK